MADNKGLLDALHRLVTDQEFRERMLIAPRETLETEFGISKENVDALIALVPVLLAGGLFVLGQGAAPKPDGTLSPQWGGWGRTP